MRLIVPSATDLADPRWFPVDLHVPRREFGFLTIDQEVLERSTFLDTRIEAPLAQSIPVSVARIAEAQMDAAPLAWLFHTSFCCSTLLARILHLPPYQVVLKEPLVLRRLADARHVQWDLQDLVPLAARLLCRPWDPQGSVVIKPTHAALNIATDLLDAVPKSKGVLLVSSLDDFLVSNLKKTHDTLAKVPVLAERALQAGSFQFRLPPAALAPPDLLAAATLQWAAQRELCADILASAGRHRLKPVDAATLLEDVAGVAWQCAQWMGLPVPQHLMQQRVAQVSGRNAKSVKVAYDAAHRRADVRVIRSKYADRLSAAHCWFEKVVAPAMRAEAFDLQECAPSEAI